MRRWKTMVCGLLAGLMLLPTALAAPNCSFADVQGHWAQESIEKAVTDGWVDGYPDGTFRPDATISRAEFVKLTLSAMHMDCSFTSWVKKSAVTISKHDFPVPYQPKKFLDMDSNWLTTQGWLETAVSFGLVVPSDYSDGKFRPSNAITRYEIAGMVYRAMGKVYAASHPLSEDLPFTDVDQIPEWVQGYINEAAKAGVLTGYPDGSFGHSRPATRAEAVTMVQRMLDYTREGVDPDINLIVKYVPDRWSSDEPAQITTKKVRMQIVDDVLYASIYDILVVQNQMMGGKISMKWHPVWQQIFATMEMTANYRAGVQNYYVGWSFTEMDDSSHSGWFRYPTRMLDGEIMIPIYDFTFDYPELRFQWDGYWDEATRTMTLSVHEQNDHHSS